MMHVLVFLGLRYLNLTYIFSMLGATNLKSTCEILTFIFIEEKNINWNIYECSRILKEYDPPLIFVNTLTLVGDSIDNWQHLN